MSETPSLTFGSEFLVVFEPWWKDCWQSMQCSYLIEQCLFWSSAEVVSWLAHLSSSTADAMNHCLSQFLHCLDPAREACQWHLAHHLDNVFMNQHSMTTFISDSDVAGQVSVDLQKLKSSIYLCTSEFGFIQAVESIYDTLGQMATIHWLLTWVLLAACHHIAMTSAFSTYSTSKVKIKELSRINTWVGKASLKRNFWISSGVNGVITLKGYHSHTASVCLISPEASFKPSEGVKVCRMVRSIWWGSWTAQC